MPDACAEPEPVAERADRHRAEAVIGGNAMADGIHAASGVCRSSGPADRSEGHKGRQPCDGRGIQGRGCGGAGRWDDCARDALRGPIVRPARRAAVAQVWRRARVGPAFHPRPDRAYSPRSARPSSTSNHRSDEQVLDQAKALVALVRLLARLAAREAWDDGRARPHDPPHGTPKVRLAWSWWSDGFAGWEGWRVVEAEWAVHSCKSD